MPFEYVLQHGVRLFVFGIIALTLLGIMFGFSRMLFRGLWSAWWRDDWDDPADVANPDGAAPRGGGKICPRDRCGTRNVVQANFCGRCGMRL